MKTLDSNEQVIEFVEVWSRSFSQILTQSGFIPSSVELATTGECSEAIAQMGQKTNYLALTGGGRLNGFGFILSESGMLQLGQILMSESVNPSVAFTDTYQNASAEFIRQAAEHARPLCGAPGRDKIEVAPGGMDRAESGLICGGLRISQENTATITVVLVATVELAKSLNARVEMNESNQVSSAETSATTPPAASAPAGHLDFLFDVKLDATIRFGERSLLLRDILQLGTSSVIELDRQINDPADLIVAGRVVAKGEIVVVNGNFGLRVTEVVNNPQGANLLSA